jgi:hypothetical protein
MRCVLPAGWVVCVVALVLTAGCSQSYPEPELQVVNVLNAQTDAWNRGDLDAFLAHHWQSDDLTCLRGGELSEGWPAVSAAYRARWPAPDQRRRLRFERIRLHPLSDGAILAVGQWLLVNSPEARRGTFSRVFQCIDDRWVIIHEHLSPPLP